MLQARRLYDSADDSQGNDPNGDTQAADDGQGGNGDQAQAQAEDGSPAGAGNDGSQGDQGAQDVPAEDNTQPAPTPASAMPLPPPAPVIDESNNPKSRAVTGFGNYNSGASHKNKQHSIKLMNKGNFGGTSVGRGASFGAETTSDGFIETSGTRTNYNAATKGVGKVSSGKRKYRADWKDGGMDRGYSGSPKKGKSNKSTVFGNFEDGANHNTADHAISAGGEGNFGGSAYGQGTSFKGLTNVNGNIQASGDKVHFNSTSRGYAKVKRRKRVRNTLDQQFQKDKFSGSQFDNNGYNNPANWNQGANAGASNDPSAYEDQSQEGESIPPQQSEKRYVPFVGAQRKK